MRKNRQSPSINAGSMADIAFLLLIFFLVSTQILNEKGIKVILPEYKENAYLKPVEADILDILINKNNQLLVEQNQIPIALLGDMVKKFILNPSHNPDYASSPQKAVIAINSDDETDYETYVQVYADVKKAYLDMWSEQALIFYGKSISQLSNEELNAIKERIPLKISEVEKFQKNKI